LYNLFLGAIFMIQMSANRGLRIAPFTVAAAGSPPLFYQWRNNGANIPSAINPTATNAILTVANVQPGEQRE
jgi:hypothetical protein